MATALHFWKASRWYGVVGQGDPSLSNNFSNQLFTYLPAISSSRPQLSESFVDVSSLLLLKKQPQ